MPHVGHVLLLQISVNALADVDQTILVTAGKPQELEVLRASGFR
jgi:hypothetical protein